MQQCDLVPQSSRSTILFIIPRMITSSSQPTRQKALLHPCFSTTSAPKKKRSKIKVMVVLQNKWWCLIKKYLHIWYLPLLNHLRNEVKCLIHVYICHLFFLRKYVLQLSPDPISSPWLCYIQRLVVNKPDSKNKISGFEYLKCQPTI